MNISFYGLFCKLTFSTRGWPRAEFFLDESSVDTLLAPVDYLDG